MNQAHERTGEPGDPAREIDQSVHDILGDPVLEAAEQEGLNPYLVDAPVDDLFVKSGTDEGETLESLDHSCLIKLVNPKLIL